MSQTVFKLKNAFLLATIVSVVLILRQYTDYLINDYNYDFSWFAVSSKNIIDYTLWALFLPIILRIANKISTNKSSLLLAIKQFFLSLIIASIHRLLSVCGYNIAYYFYYGYMNYFLAPKNKVALGAGLFSSFLEYWIIILLLMAISYYSRYTEQQKELSNAKLNALKMQLQPHFLFNTLNSITSLIDIDSKKAQKMLTQLGFLMRELLEHDKKHFITLENEMQYIKTYLEIEHIRFQDRLTLDINVDARTLEAKVPALLLQPIVENAIKHGIAKQPNGGEIAIQCHIKKIDGADYLSISLSNDYTEMNGQSTEAGYGIGVKNVANRLEQLYGDDHTFLNHTKNGKFHTEIAIPFQKI